MADEVEQQEIVIDGEVVDMENWTYRQLRDLKNALKEIHDIDEVDIDDMSLVDVLPGMIYVVMHGKDPEFTMDQALDFKLTDNLRTVSQNGGPPTKPAKQPAAKKKSSARG